MSHPLTHQKEGQAMPTKITIVIDNPESPEEFERAYASIRAAVEEFPGLQRVESAKVWPKEDGTPTPAYRTLDLYFASYEDASAAVATATAGTVFGGLTQTGVTFMGLFSNLD
jgi:hypothetical protein